MPTEQAKKISVAEAITSLTQGKEVQWFHSTQDSSSLQIIDGQLIQTLAGWLSHSIDGIPLIMFIEGQWLIDR